MQPDGKILAAGGQTRSGVQTILARYDERGELDPTFDGDGRFFGDAGAATDIAVQRDRKIVVAVGGDLAAVIRLNPDGTPDRTFNGGVVGFGAQAPWLRVALQRDGKVVAAGGRAIVRLTRRGRLDRTFSRDGRVRTPVIVRDAVLTRDGKVVIAGVWSHPEKRSTGDKFPIEMIVARYRANGTLDRTFGRRGVVVRRLEMGHCCVLSALAVQRNGRILIGGYAIPGGAAVARLNRNGSEDFTFGRLGIARFGDAGVGSLALDRRGRIVAGLRLGFGVARLTASGTRDFEAGVATIGRADTWALAVDRNDRIVIAGYLEAPLGQRDFAVARFLTR